MVNMTPCAFWQGTRSQYQLAVVISHLSVAEEWVGHDIPFVNIFDQWFRFGDTDVQAVDESAAFEGNYPETDGPTQTATILLYVSYN
jgi:hypothetical protein